MFFNDETVERFRVRMTEECGEALSFIEAKERYLNLMHLFWILAHKAPKEGEPPRDPPLPPWF